MKKFKKIRILIEKDELGKLKHVVSILKSLHGYKIKFGIKNVSKYDRYIFIVLTIANEDELNCLFYLEKYLQSYMNLPY